jgi:hypothetical protein
MFRYVWPEHAVDQLRVTLARVLRTISQLVCLPKPGSAMETDGSTVKSLHTALSNDLDNVLVLSEQSAVENVMFDNPKIFSSTLIEHIASHIQSLGLISTALMRRTKLEEWQLLNQSAQSSEAELRLMIAEYMRCLAASVENHQSFPGCQLDSAVVAKWNSAAPPGVGNDRPRLVRRLVDQVQSLT